MDLNGTQLVSLGRGQKLISQGHEFQQNHLVMFIYIQALANVPFPISPCDGVKCRYFRRYVAVLWSIVSSLLVVDECHVELVMWHVLI